MEDHIVHLLFIANGMHCMYVVERRGGEQAKALGLWKNGREAGIFFEPAA